MGKEKIKENRKVVGNKHTSIYIYKDANRLWAGEECPYMPHTNLQSSP